MGHYGCISRRLNDYDRLVYKVTGPAEITILSVGGIMSDDIFSFLHQRMMLKNHFFNVLWHNMRINLGG